VVLGGLLISRYSGSFNSDDSLATPVQSALEMLPGWLVDGALLGVAGSLLVAVLFYAFVRYFPGRAASAGRKSGRSQRRDEFRASLDAIGERYTEDHVLDGQRVAFYLPDRAVAITFDARAHYRIDRPEVEVVLVEHEMRGPQLGSRLPFETPDLGTSDEQLVDPRAAAFAVLGLPAGADEEAVRRAYREKVKEVHPDHGGDPEEFERVREAYTTAREYAN
jgi:hypothetical protein